MTTDLEKGTALSKMSKEDLIKAVNKVLDDSFIEGDMDWDEHTAERLVNEIVGPLVAKVAVFRLDLKCAPSWDAFDALNLRAALLGELLNVAGPMFKRAQETVDENPLPKEQNWVES